MKKYNLIFAGVIAFYICMAALVLFSMKHTEAEGSKRYRVELNEIMKGLERQGVFSKPDLLTYDYIKEVAFLSPEEASDMERVKEFFRNRNKVSSKIEPFIINNEWRGYIRFDYVIPANYSLLGVMEGILFAFFFFVLLLLIYIKDKIIKPFHVLSDMPFELSKGHLKGDIEESKNRFFGRFTWGITMLRDALEESRKKELKLEKEKKMLLLSLSHDIKIPLSTIKLYAKALKEGIYDTEEKRVHAAEQIETHSIEIEQFVKEIIATSREEIFVINLVNSEFYLKELIDKIKDCYEPKCKLIMTELIIENYDNKLLKGDRERAFEVVENLMENAFKYGDGKRIRISFYEEDYCQVIKIFNSGDRMSVEEMPHLFDSFYRGSNVGNKEGNGLGLYISREIMQKMEGNIFAEREAEGMSFSLVVSEIGR